MCYYCQFPAVTPCRCNECHEVFCQNCYSNFLKDNLAKCPSCFVDRSTHRKAIQCKVFNNEKLVLRQELMKKFNLAWTCMYS